jgi:CRP-like cAMP-binding protein
MASEMAAELLLEVPLFARLSLQEIRDLLVVAEDRQYKAGEIIFEQGVTDRALYVVLYGQVEVRLALTAFDEAAVSTITGPSVVGESSFFHPAPHAASVHCMTAVRAIRIERSIYDLLASDKPVVAFKLAMNAAEILARRLQETDRWIEELLEEVPAAQVAASWRDFRSRTGFTFGPNRWGP